MKFLFSNIHELSALMELPHIQRVTYLMGIRPYMDRQTCIVGIKRRISYQSLREILYVGPIAGVKTGSPSPQQVKRAVKSLERAGLIEIQSTTRHLIFKCILAELDKDVLKQADLRTTPNPTQTQHRSNLNIVTDYGTKIRPIKDIHTKTDPAPIIKADPPQKSENKPCVYSKFEQFWNSYPQPQYKREAWKAFSDLNPDDNEFEQMMKVLIERITRVFSAENGASNWITPANWIMYKYWQKV